MVSNKNMIYLTAIAVSFVALCLFTVAVVIFSPDSFNHECGVRHNFYRHKHRSPAVSISKTVVDYAKKRAEELKQTGQFEQMKNSPYGENLYSTSFGSKQPDILECEKAISFWYKESVNYDFKSGEVKNGTTIKHFAQLVWTDSLQIGCAKSYSEKNKTAYFVCNYEPPGDLSGRYIEKVPVPV